MPRAKRCSKRGCKALAEKAGKCQRHHLADWRAGVVIRQVDDLGDDPVRFEFKAPRELAEALEAVPRDKRARFFREATREKLERMRAEAKEASPEHHPLM